MPKVATEDEKKYIDELFLAYADVLKLPVFTRDDLSRFPDCSEDLDDRRIDFNAAESIKRGVQELKSTTLTGQFDVLKNETYTNVRDTVRRPYPSAYDRMLAVMD